MIQNNDINSEIDRILSCNIKDQLLSHIPIQMLQSPAIRKKYFREQASSAKTNNQNFQQDLYEKAQQIIKLKQTLEAQLSNINQIVEDNQKLTEANLYLTQELKKIKSDWKTFKCKVIQELNDQRQNSYRTQTQILQTLKDIQNKNLSKVHKLSLVSVFEIRNDAQRFEIEMRQKLKINSQQVVQFLKPQKRNLSSFMCQTQICSQQIDELKNKLQKLNQQNARLQEQIETFKKDSTTSNKIQKYPNHLNINNPTPIIECYTSVFLKTEYSQKQNPQEIIKSALFSELTPFFQSLKESKYFGKIILGKKNGSALQQYTNGFIYQGNFSRNQRNEMGKLSYKDKVVYTGEWKKGRFNGKGILYYYMNLSVQKIQGNFKNGMLEGHSTITLHSGCKIRALFKNNKILPSAMLVPHQNQRPNNLKNESYLGKVQLKNVSANQDKLTFITNAGQMIQL